MELMVATEYPRILNYISGLGLLHKPPIAFNKAQISISNPRRCGKALKHKFPQPNSQLSVFSIPHVIERVIHTPQRNFVSQTQFHILHVITALICYEVYRNLMTNVSWWDCTHRLHGSKRNITSVVYELCKYNKMLPLQKNRIISQCELAVVKGRIVIN